MHCIVVRCKSYNHTRLPEHGRCVFLLRKEQVSVVPSETCQSHLRLPSKSSGGSPDLHCTTHPVQTRREGGSPANSGDSPATGSFCLAYRLVKTYLTLPCALHHHCHRSRNLGPTDHSMTEDGPKSTGCLSRRLTCAVTPSPELSIVARQLPPTCQTVDAPDLGRECGPDRGYRPLSLVHGARLRTVPDERDS